MSRRPYRGLLKKPMTYDPDSPSPPRVQTLAQWLARLSELYRHYGFDLASIEDGSGFKLAVAMINRHCCAPDGWPAERERLLAEYRIDEDETYADARLAIILAEKYVPGFGRMPVSKKKRSGGPKNKMTPAQIFSAYAEVNKLRVDRRLSERSACKIIWSRAFKDICSEATFRQNINIISNCSVRSIINPCPNDPALVQHYSSELSRALLWLKEEDPDEYARLSPFFLDGDSPESQTPD